MDAKVENKGLCYNAENQRRLRSNYDLRAIEDFVTLRSAFREGDGKNPVSTACSCVGIAAQRPIYSHIFSHFSLSEYILSTSSQAFM